MKQHLPNKNPPTPPLKKGGKGGFIFLFLFLLTATQEAQAYERIISFRPNITEILFGLGLGPKVVGVTQFCHYPPEAEKIEKIGGYFNRSLEKILSLKPDLVVLVPDGTTSKTESALRRSGIEVLVVHAESIDDVYASIHAIASKTGIPQKGEALVLSLTKKIKEQSDRIATLPSKKVLVVVQRRPLIVAGQGTFLDDLLKWAHAENTAGSSKLPYPHYSMESAMSRRPDVILDIDSSESENFWERYPSIPAVSHNTVYRLPPDIFVPGTRLPEALALLIQKIHPSTSSGCPLFCKNKIGHGEPVEP